MSELTTSTPNKVFAVGGIGPGNAFHHYTVTGADGFAVGAVHFQCGPRNVEGSTPGIFGDELLAILQHRLECFQSGPFACDENAEALAAVIAAREAMARRTNARAARGVLGTNTP